MAAKKAFRRLTEAEMRQWVEANPGRVNDRDWLGQTLLYVAVLNEKSLSLIVWLLDEKGADVNIQTSEGLFPVEEAQNFDILTAFLDRGAIPIPQGHTFPLLMNHARNENVKSVARLLEDPRVRATLNVQNEDGHTALHLACQSDHNHRKRDCIVHLLLQAGINPLLTDTYGNTALACLRKLRRYPYTTIALLEQAPDAEKTSLLVKARRLVIAAISPTVTPSYLREQVLRGKPLPRVAFAPVLIGCNGEERLNKLGLLLIHLFGQWAGPREDDEKRRKFHSLMAYLLAMGGGGARARGCLRTCFCWCWISLCRIGTRSSVSGRSCRDRNQFKLSEEKDAVDGDDAGDTKWLGWRRLDKPIQNSCSGSITTRKKEIFY